jgi:hypothetical protein
MTAKNKALQPFRALPLRFIAAKQTLTIKPGMFCDHDDVY